MLIRCVRRFTSSIFLIFPINPCFFPMNLLFPIPYQRFINSFSLLCKRNFSCAGDGRNDAITSGETMLISLTRFSLHHGESSRTPFPDIRALSNNPSRNSSASSTAFCDSAITKIFLSFLSSLLKSS